MKTSFIKKRISRIITFPLFILLLCSMSCETEKIEYFDLRMVFYEPLDQDQNDEKLPAKYGMLMNFYSDTVSKKRIFVPNVILERGDYDPPKLINYEFPLSGVNKFRKSLNMLAALSLKEDYNSNISDLKTPQILLEKEGKAIDTHTNNSIKSHISINCATFNLDSAKILHKKIKDLLNSEKVEGKINLIFYTMLSPTVQTDSATAIQRTSATLKGKVNPNGQSTQVSFEYGTSDNYGSTIEVSGNPLSGNTEALISANISGLTSNTTYHYRLKAINPAGTGYSEDQAFTTLSRRNCPSRGTITLTSGDVYVGELKNCKPHGIGTLTFTRSGRICEYGDKNQIAAVGDILKGTWRSGELQIGELTNRFGTYKFTVICGGE